MTLISLVIVLAVVGVLLWLFNAKVTMIDGTIKQIINVVVIIAAVILVLKAFGLLDGLNAVTVG